MYEELIGELRHYFDDVPLVLQAADAIEELSKICTEQNKVVERIAEEKVERLPVVEAWADEAANAQPRWISVTERLPESLGNVLACFDDVVCVAFYANNQWFESATISPFFPDYWMPLPEPPKEEV